MQLKPILLSAGLALLSAAAFAQDNPGGAGAMPSRPDDLSNGPAGTSRDMPSCTPNSRAQAMAQDSGVANHSASGQNCATQSRTHHNNSTNQNGNPDGRDTNSYNRNAPGTPQQ